MSTYLDIRTSITTVERALIDALSLGYQIRYPTANVAALASIPSVGAGNAIIDQALRFVATEGVCYRWRELSTNVDAPPYVILPRDRPANSRGRFERCASTVTFGPNYQRPVHREPTGYAKAVQLWQGDEGTEAGRERVLGQSPAFLVRWAGDELTMAGPTPRSIHECDMPFEVWCWARNNRAQRQALEGSTYAGEEPGLFRMMGDVRYLLAGSDLGLSPGVRYVDIQGHGDIIEEDLRERSFIGVVPITVKASLNIPDEDLIDLREVCVQFQQMGGPSPAIDSANCLRRGYRITPSAGLSATPTAGVAYVQGQAVSSQPTSHLFPANSDTYRFLGRDGGLVYRPVPNGYDAPSQPPATLLIGKTITDASNVTLDVLLCDYLTDSGEIFRAA
jgi:hypothetical protein